MAAIDQLIQDLRADGSVESEGRFTLDREQARAKMQKFQLADPRRYVLELVQAAVLRGATAIHFDIDADDMRMRFDGEPFTAAEFDDLYGSLFGEGDSRKLRSVRQLALALNAALGMEPKHIHVRSGVTELRMAPGQKDAILVHSRADARTEIHVRQPLRLRVFVDFLLNLTGRLGEEQYLRQRCIYSTVPVFLDGVQISRGLDSGEGLHSLALSGADYRGYLRIVERLGPCVLHLVKDGVWIDSKELPRVGTQLVAVIEGDNLRKDVSQARIVETAALERIEAALGHARWQLWTLARDARQGEPRKYLDAVIRGQLLEASARAELLGDERCRALAAGVSWPDARDLGRRHSLAALADHAAERGPIRYARRHHSDVPVDDEPVLLIEEQAELVRLREVLGVELIQADELLARAQRRAVGRKQWLTRKAEPDLPSHVSYAVRGRFRVAHELGPIWGDVGVDMHLYTSPDIEAPLHLFLHKEGRLLGRHEVDVGLANLWLAIEGPFEPNDDYTGAVPDKAYIHALLHGLAALADPLAELIRKAPDEWARGRARALAKRWLTAMVDRGEQIPLLTRAGADVSNEFFVPGLVPGLDAAALLGREPPRAKLADSPLFDTLDDEGLSLRRLWALIHEQDKLEYVERMPADARLRKPGVAVLGTGDRKLVRALIGEQRLVAWDAEAKQRELAFWDQPPGSLAAQQAALERELATRGLDRAVWRVELDGPVRGFVGLLPTDAARTNPAASVQLRVCYADRALCEVPAIGLGGAITVVEHPDLRPSAGWDDVVRDAAFEELVTAAKAGSDRLVANLAAILPALAEDQADPLRELLLEHVSAVYSAWKQVRGGPLLTTLRGEPTSLDQAAAWAEQHGRLGYVSRDLAVDGAEAVAGAPILRVSERELVALRKLIETAFEDASDRVRYRDVYNLLADRPELREAKLDPGAMLVRVPLAGEGQTGEIGLPRTRTAPGLALRLGFAGREAGEIEDHNDFFVPVDAVVIDEQLPLDERGEIKRKSKRLRNLVRQIRRRLPELIQAVCAEWSDLDDAVREPAWTLLLQYLAAEANAGSERRQAREDAVLAASAVPGFRAVCGRRVSLAELRGASGKRSIDVLSAARHAGLEVEDVDLGRPIAIVDERELACLQAHGEVRVLDEVWEAELAMLRELANAPELETPDVDAIALAYRKAQVAGGLEAELWIPRAISPISAPGGLQLRFARAGREVGGGIHHPALPYQGIARGEGLRVSGGTVELDDRQEHSLERQALILYSELADKVAGGRLSASDHERALEYLAWAANSLRAYVGDDHGKHRSALQQQLARLVAPSLRDAVAQRLAPEPALEPAPERAPEVDTSATPAPSRFSPLPLSPDQRLLAAIRAELGWARARHEQLEGLLLDRLRLAAWDRAGIAAIDGAVLLVNREHPIVARLLAQDPHDPIDLHFLTAALYSLLNYEAEDIGDDDEREFVAQLAETLALETRAQVPAD